MTEERLKDVQNAGLKKRPPPIPDNLIDPFIQYEQTITDNQFESGYYFLSLWDKVQDFYVNWFMEKYNEYSENYAYGRAHSWFEEHIAGKIGIDSSTLRHRYNVCRDVPRATKERFPDLTFSHWRLLRRGEHEDKSKNVIENLEWVEEETNRRGGSPPSTRDLEAHITHTGDTPLWKKRMRAAFAALGGILEDGDAPEWALELARIVVEKISERLGEGEK